MQNLKLACPRDEIRRCFSNLVLYRCSEVLKGVPDRSCDVMYLSLRDYLSCPKVCGATQFKKVKYLNNLNGANHMGTKCGLNGD
jgi:hypothetical protein